MNPPPLEKMQSCDGVWDNHVEKFLWRLKMDRVHELICNRARLASMRHDWKEVQRLERLYRPQLQTLGLLLSEEVVLASEEEKGKPKDVAQRPPAGDSGRVGQRVEAEAVLGRRRELGGLGAARAREDVHPVVKAWRDGHAKVL